MALFVGKVIVNSCIVHRRAMECFSHESHPGVFLYAKIGLLTINYYPLTVLEAGCMKSFYILKPGR